jgi:hypothetical protein
VISMIFPNLPFSVESVIPCQGKKGHPGILHYLLERKRVTLIMMSTIKNRNY